MRISAVVGSGVGIAAGIAAAVAGYHATSAVDQVPASGSYSVGTPALGRPLPAAPPQITVSMAPCEPPAELRHGSCVTEVEHTVVVYDGPSASQGQGSSGSAAGTASSQGSRADEPEDQADDEATEASEPQEAQEQESEDHPDEYEAPEPPEPGDD